MIFIVVHCLILIVPNLLISAFYYIDILTGLLKFFFKPILTYVVEVFLDSNNKTELISAIDEFYFNNSIDTASKYDVSIIKKN